MVLATLFPVQNPSFALVYGLNANGVVSNSFGVGQCFKTLFP